MSNYSLPKQLHKDTCTHSHTVTQSHITTPASRPSRGAAPSCQCFWFESVNGATRATRHPRVWSAEILLPLPHSTRTHTHTHTSPPASKLPILHKHPSASLVITVFPFFSSPSQPQCSSGSLVLSVPFFISTFLFYVFTIIFDTFFLTLPQFLRFLKLCSINISFFVPHTRACHDIHNENMFTDDRENNRFIWVQLKLSL